MEKTKIKQRIITLIFILFVILITAFITNKLIFQYSVANIVNNKLISWGPGWKNNQSVYSGSEFGFSFNNSGEISFEFTTPSKADQGAQILVDGDTYFISSPNLNKQKLSISVDKHRLHTVRIRHFCTAQDFPCDITIKNIYVDTFTELFPYKKGVRKIVSILGDSISTNYGKDNYSLLLADALGYQLHNASVFGSTVSKVKDIDNAVPRYQKDMRGFDSDAIIIFLGTIDATRNAPLGEFENDYSAMVDNIKKWNPKSKIFLTGILSRRDIDYQILNSYSNIIKNLSLKHNVSFIDTSSWLNDRDFSDEIHPSIEAQKKLSERFLQAIFPAVN